MTGIATRAPKVVTRGTIRPWLPGRRPFFPLGRPSPELIYGTYRATVRHGVSRVTAGERLSLGIIFHDAE